MDIKVKANTNEEFYKGDDRGFLVLVQRMIEDSWYPKVRKAVKNATFDCYEMDGDDFVICFEADGDGVDESTTDILQDLADNAVKAGCDKANSSTDPTIADYGLDADYVAWDEPELFHNQWSYAVNLSSKPKGKKGEGYGGTKSVMSIWGNRPRDVYPEVSYSSVNDMYNTLLKYGYGDMHPIYYKNNTPEQIKGHILGYFKWTPTNSDADIEADALAAATMIKNNFNKSEAKKITNEKLRYEKGHKNSKGEDAPWVIRSHEDNRILASFADKSDAQEHLGRMKQYSEQESMQKETKKSEAFQCAYAQIGHDIPDKVIDSIMGELQDLLETYEKDSGGEALDVSCYGDGMDWELYVVAPVGKEKWLLNFLDGLGYAKLQDKWHTRLREHDVPVQHGGIFELTGNGLYKNPYPGTRFNDVKEALFVTKTIKTSKQSERLFNKQELERIAIGDKDYDKCVKDVKTLLKSKYGMDVDDKDTSRLCKGWMNKLDAMLYQGKSVEDCAKAVAKFCGFAKDNESVSESDGEMTEEAVLSLIDKLSLEVVNKWFDGNKSRPVFDCRDKCDEAGETVCVAVEPPYEARVWFKDVNPRVNHYTEDIITIGDLEDTLKEFFHIDAAESKKTESTDDNLRSRMEKVGNELLESGNLHSWDYDFIKECLAFSEYKKLEQYLIRKGLYNPPTEANKSEGIKLEFQDTLRVPMWLWHAYNFDDTTDLTDEEIEKFNQFKEEYKDCHLDDKGGESYFSSRNDFDDLGGPVYDVDVYKMSYKDEKKSEALSSKTTYPFSFKFKFESPRVTYAVRDEIDKGDYKGSKLNCVDDDATECEVFTDNPKVIYGLLENVCKRYNDTYDGKLIPDDLKNRFKIGFGLVKTDDPNLDDTALRFSVAINTRQPDGVMVSGELDNVVDFLDELK